MTIDHDGDALGADDAEQIDADTAITARMVLTSLDTVEKEIIIVMMAAAPSTGPQIAGDGIVLRFSP